MQKKILVLEESKLVHALFQTALPEEWDWEVHIEGDPSNFMAAAEGSLPSVILLSSQDQKRDFSTVKALAEHPKLAGTPIILLTSARETFQDQYLSTLGVMGYLRKPFEFETLSEHVEEVYEQTKNRPKHVFDALDLVEEGVSDLLKGSMAEALAEPEVKRVDLGELEEELDPSLKLEKAHLVPPVEEIEPVDFTHELQEESGSSFEMDEDLFDEMDQELGAQEQEIYSLEEGSESVGMADFDSVRAEAQAESETDSELYRIEEIPEPELTRGEISLEEMELEEDYEMDEEEPEDYESFPMNELDDTFSTVEEGLEGFGESISDSPHGRQEIPVSFEAAPEGGVENRSDDSQAVGLMDLSLELPRISGAEQTPIDEELESDLDQIDLEEPELDGMEVLDFGRHGYDQGDEDVPLEDEYFEGEMEEGMEEAMEDLPDYEPEYEEIPDFDEEEAAFEEEELSGESFGDLEEVEDLSEPGLMPSFMQADEQEPYFASRSTGVDELDEQSEELEEEIPEEDFFAEPEEGLSPMSAEGLESIAEESEVDFFSEPEDELEEPEGLSDEFEDEDAGFDELSEPDLSSEEDFFDPELEGGLGEIEDFAEEALTPEEQEEPIEEFVEEVIAEEAELESMEDFSEEAELEPMEDFSEEAEESDFFSEPPEEEEFSIEPIEEDELEALDALEEEAILEPEPLLEEVDELSMDELMTESPDFEALEEPMEETGLDHVEELQPLSVEGLEHDLDEPDIPHVEEETQIHLHEEESMAPIDEYQELTLDVEESPEETVFSISNEEETQEELELEQDQTVSLQIDFGDEVELPTHEGEAAKEVTLDLEEGDAEFSLDDLAGDPEELSGNIHQMINLRQATRAKYEVDSEAVDQEWDPFQEEEEHLEELPLESEVAPLEDEEEAAMMMDLHEPNLDSVEDDLLEAEADELLAVTEEAEEGQPIGFEVPVSFEPQGAEEVASAPIEEEYDVAGFDESEFNMDETSFEEPEASEFEESGFEEAEMELEGPGPDDSGYAESGFEDTEMDEANFDELEESEFEEAEMELDEAELDESGFEDPGFDESDFEESSPMEEESSLEEVMESEPEEDLEEPVELMEPEEMEEAAHVESLPAEEDLDRFDDEEDLTFEVESEVFEMGDFKMSKVVSEEELAELDQQASQDQAADSALEAQESAELDLEESETSQAEATPDLFEDALSQVEEEELQPLPLDDELPTGDAEEEADLTTAFAADMDEDEVMEEASEEEVFFEEPKKEQEVSFATGQLDLLDMDEDLPDLQPIPATRGGDVETERIAQAQATIDQLDHGIKFLHDRDDFDEEMGEPGETVKNRTAVEAKVVEEVNRDLIDEDIDRLDESSDLDELEPIEEEGFDGLDSMEEGDFEPMESFEEPMEDLDEMEASGFEEPMDEMESMDEMEASGFEEPMDEMESMDDFGSEDLGEMESMDEMEPMEDLDEMEASGFEEPALATATARSVPTEISAEFKARLGGMIEGVVQETIKESLEEMLPEMMDKIVKEELED